MSSLRTPGHSCHRSSSSVSNSGMKEVPSDCTRSPCVPTEPHYSNWYLHGSPSDPVPAYSGRDPDRWTTPTRPVTSSRRSRRPTGTRSTMEESRHRNRDPGGSRTVLPSRPSAYLLLLVEGVV